MKQNDEEIFQALEVLAKHCPWERVDIWVTRQPAGIYNFTAYSAGLTEAGFGSAWGHSDESAMAAVEMLMKEHPERDPEAGIKKKIRELEMQIAKLRVLSFKLPPYRAPGQIGYGVRPDAEPPPACSAVIEMDKDGVPF